MKDTVVLPTDTRFCPQCEGSMAPRGATLGGGWGGSAIRFLYVCDSCDHQALLEAEGTLSRLLTVSWLLILLGVGISLFLAKPNNILFALIWGLLGGAGIYSVQRVRNSYPVRAITDSEQPSVVAVEENITLSEGEQGRRALWDRYTGWVIYGVISITLAFMLFEWLVE